MRVLGIDPGLRLTGYACLETTRADEVPRIIEAGVFRLIASSRASSSASSRAKTTTARTSSSAPSVSARLLELDRDLQELIIRVKPDHVAVESLFAHYKHPATAIIMGHARGVILLAIRRAGIPLLEFKPNLVKKSLTGHGHADKGQMQRSVQTIFGLAEPPSPPDVADAIAIALCACRRAG
ncbi:MAG: crossover junction endodeoxyribonuclease RuvC [Planctomycetes bacterium]|nr:crossover junction endodeoxyribonuclease RuvC [Planctomycetota bacterium]